MLANHSQPLHEKDSFMNQSSKPSSGRLTELLASRSVEQQKDELTPEQLGFIAGCVQHTQKSIPISVTGGAIGAEPSTLQISWFSDGEERSAEIFASRVSRIDGYFDVLLHGLPKELELVSVHSIKRTSEDFAPYDDFFWANQFGDISPVDSIRNSAEVCILRASGSDGARRLLSVSVDWSDGTHPTISIKAGKDDGPFFGVFQAEFGVGEKVVQTILEPFCIEDFIGDDFCWRKQLDLLWPAEVDTVAVTVRPIDAKEFHRLGENDSKFLQHRVAEVWGVEIERNQLRINGVSPDVFEGQFSLVFRGVTVTRPFTKDDRLNSSWEPTYLHFWKLLEPVFQSAVRSYELQWNDQREQIQGLSVKVGVNLNDLVEVERRSGTRGVMQYGARMAYNSCIDHFRKKGLDTIDTNDLANLLEDRCDFVDRFMLNAESRYYLDELNDSDREVLETFYEGATIEEIAAQRGVKATKIRYAIKTAEHRLRLIHRFRIVFGPGGFGTDALLTEPEITAVLDKMIKRPRGEELIANEDELSPAQIRHAREKVEMVLALFAACDTRGESFTAQQTEWMEDWLSRQAFDDDMIVSNEECRLATMVHGQILLDHYRLNETERIYIQQRIVLRSSWAETRILLKQCKARGNETVTPADEVPTKVATLWDKRKSLVLPYCRVLQMPEAKSAAMDSGQGR